MHMKSISTLKLLTFLALILSSFSGSGAFASPDGAADVQCSCTVYNELGDCEASKMCLGLGDGSYQCINVSSCGVW